VKHVKFQDQGKERSLHHHHFVVYWTNTETQKHVSWWETNIQRSFKPSDSSLSL